MNAEISELIKAINAKRSRRSALRSIGIGALGMGAFGLFEPKARAEMSNDQTDADILNFALNLEYLEAQYYSYATTGGGIQEQGVETNGVGTQGNVIIKASPMVPFSSANDAIKQFASGIASDERNHVNFFRTALGANAVAMPNIDLLNSFNTASQAAGLGSNFDPFSNETNFLIGAYIFEDVGVTAFHGAAALINNKDYLTGAAGFLGTEAYHAALVRTLLFQMGSDTQTATAKISTLRATLSGKNDDQGVVVGGNANIVPRDSNGAVFARTTRQVLNIVYGGAEAPSGLFYPGGMNGAIH